MSASTASMCYLHNHEKNRSIYSHFEEGSRPLSDEVWRKVCLTGRQEVLEETQTLRASSPVSCRGGVAPGSER